MRLCWLGVILTPFLAAQEVGTLDLRTDLGTDPIVHLRLVHPGCWDSLILHAAPQPLRAPQRGDAGATVEVWDLAYQDTPRREAFNLTLKALRDRLIRAFAAPPPSHGKIELSELVASDPSNPQQLDLTKVQSMQERFNPPPRTSPAQ
ncbi:hypothetical protein [Geothrix alkalitolerans]|uniref:hypothetical protein n=1 Tax=Geothrix alkalitolerans TaxID=2922724 RepID=UPI001FAF7376|nr:hypothetical protein [Geothrix alkalitolerans]